MKMKLQTLTCNHLRQSGDEVNALGRGWALYITKLKPYQKIFAKNPLNDLA
jgi:hypothetical protein